MTFYVIIEALLGTITQVTWHNLLFSMHAICLRERGQIFLHEFVFAELLLRYFEIYSRCERQGVHK